MATHPPPVLEVVEELLDQVSPFISADRLPGAIGAQDTALHRAV
jgi:hypothetical protein